MSVNSQLYPINYDIDEREILLNAKYAKRTDVLLIGDVACGKTSVLTGLFAAGVDENLLVYNQNVLINNYTAFRVFYQMLESKTKYTFCIPQHLLNLCVIPCDLHTNSIFNKSRKLNFFETSGEYWQLYSQSMYKLDDDNFRNSAPSIYMRNQNRKILCFLVDYQKVITGDDDQQRMLLENVLYTLSHDNAVGASSINCTLSKVDAVMVLITKADLMNTESRERREEMSTHLLLNNYKSFMVMLSEVCTKYFINAKNGFKPYISTYSIGKSSNGVNYNFNPVDSIRLLNWFSIYAVK